MALHVLQLSALAISFSLPAVDVPKGRVTEVLPPPKEVQAQVSPPVVIALPPPTGFYRTNRYDVWQAYEVDRRGGFRPRVIYSPSGAYYYRDGHPYPWTTTQPEVWKPVILGTP
jgi:hypothetical protein